MPSSLNPKNIDVVILCGGLGTRLRPVLSDKPKVLAVVGNKPVLGHLLDYLLGFGFRRFILSVGHLGEQIKDYVSSGFRKNSDIEFLFSEEDEPLGTGGALKHAMKLVKSDHFLALNGDSIFGFNVADFLEHHLKNEALVTLAVAKSTRTDGGTLSLEGTGKISDFREKEGDRGEKYISAGMYFMRRGIISFIPDKKVFSLEYDFFPGVVKSGNCFGFVTLEKFWDIGTPERYKEASDYFGDPKLV